VQRQAARRRNGEAHVVGKGMADGRPAAAPERARLAGIAGDCADHVCADACVGRWCDAAPDRRHPRHIGRQATHRRRRQDGKARHSGKHKYPGAAGSRIEGMDAFGQIEIVNAMSNTGFDDPIPTLPISLKRPTGIDENVGPERDKVRGEVAVPVEDRGDELGLGFVARFAVGACMFEGAAGDVQDQARLVLQQFDDTASERAIAADDQNAEAAVHPMNRSACVASGR
jgi:hypothetical protein